MQPTSRTGAPRRAAAAMCRAPLRVVARAGRSGAVRGPPPQPVSEVTVLVPGDLDIAPATAPSHSSSVGVGVAGAALVAAAALGFAWTKLRARSADMGYHGSHGGRSDPFMRDMMRNVNMVQMEELSSDAIAAARARRSRERANHKLALEDVELPENHPWATRKPMTQEQEEAIQARLQVRPRGAQRGSAGAGGPSSEQRRQRARD